MAKMAAESVCGRQISGRNSHFVPFWKASRRFKLQIHPHFSTTIRASQSIDDKSKFLKQLGLFSLRKKIEDSVDRVEMLAPTALDREEERHIEHEELLREYNLWDDLAKSNEILVKLADGAKMVDALKDLTYKAEEVKLITELAELDAINYGLFEEAYAASVDVGKFLDKYETSKLFKGPYEIEGACLVIEAGSEGIHPEIWAEQLVEMYMKWAGKHGYQGRIVEKYPSKSGGVKSTIVEFESKYAYGYFSGEIGIHRMITSRKGSVYPEATVATVDVIPLFLEAAPDLYIDDKDLNISTRLSCDAEQDRTKPAVHIHHIPTGIRVQSSGERSCFANKIKALDRLKAKLLVIMTEQGISSLTSIKKDDMVDVWEQETRRYIFQRYKHVHDIKTGIKLLDLKSVLVGNIDPFISAHILSRHTCNTSVISNA